MFRVKVPAIRDRQELAFFIGAAVSGSMALLLMLFFVVRHMVLKLRANKLPLMSVDADNLYTTQMSLGETLLGN